MSFLAAGDVGLSLAQRLKLLLRFYRVSRSVECAHSESQIIHFSRAVLGLPKTVKGCLVEAGCFKGGTSAKFSILAKAANRELVTFDSFEGIPDNQEDHGQNIFGGEVGFLKGDYRGDFREVTENVRRYGEIQACRFVKGFFEDTMPSFHQPVAAAYLDVDLASSTRDCLRYLWPLLSPGGVVFSQDGHLPLVLEVFKDVKFWRDELGCMPPQVEGMGQQQLVWFSKPASAVLVEQMSNAN
ncbi:MAG: TylF/MycF/NovP-related O-methyltransferase [Bryobacteraceae bacterium]